MVKCPLGVKSSLVGNHWFVAVMGIVFFLNPDWVKHVSEFWLLRSHRQVFKGDSGKFSSLLSKKCERQMAFLILKDTYV